jgi:hypothetical protein
MHVQQQADQPLLTLGAKKPGAVHGMEAESMQWGSVAHVMQERGRDKQVVMLGQQDRGHATRLLGNARVVAGIFKPAAAGLDSPAGGASMTFATPARACSPPRARASRRSRPSSAMPRRR